MRPHASPLIERFSPDFWATFVPGSSTVPLADLTMFVIWSASTTTTQYVSAIWVVVLCCQSAARRMREVCQDFEAELKQFNGEQDHVHLLVHYPPKVQLSKLVNSLKGVSSRRLRQEYDAHVRRYLWGGHFWSGSYFAGSCGGAPLTVVKQYIENQQRPAG